METVPHPAQEGTSLSDRDTGVTLEVHNAPQCTAVNDILARVGDKWSVRVVMGLADGSRRFNELRRDIPGISQRMLTRTLRGLERDGLVSRTVTPSVPPRVDYALTALGVTVRLTSPCRIYTSDAAGAPCRVDLGGRRIVRIRDQPRQYV